MKKCPKCGKDYSDTTTLCPNDGIALEVIGDPLIGQTLAGKYRIDERLTDGGMGTVYRGTHILMDKTVAIKVLRSSLAADPTIVARFSREARAASRISHPHALSVTDFGEDEFGRVFLVMEFLQGRTLKEIVRSDGPMPLGRVVEIIRQVGDALDTAHGQGVVHRDLKSDNIMLLSTGGADYAKVLDFGIAKITEPEGGQETSLTSPDLVIGTPQYMSPEQCSQSADIDARSDIYSLGVIIFEMLTGHVPFSGESATALMLKHLQDAPPSLLEARPDLPASVGNVVARALAKIPDNRYQKVSDLVEDLTIASGLDAASSGAASTPGTSQTGVDSDIDEQTVVRPRVPVRPIYTPPPIPPQPVGHAFNPWKVLIPSAVGVLVVFAVIFALTQKSDSPVAPQAGPTLVADPNSTPVEAASPATGKPEEGIPAGGTVAVQPANVNANANANSNANVESSPSPAANANTNENTNSNANTNANSNRKAPSLPSPSVPVNEPPPPPPTPAESKTPKPNPTLPAPRSVATPN